MPPPPAATARSCKPWVKSRRVVCNAGARPKMTPLKSASNTAIITTRKSGCGSSESGTGVAGKSEIKTSPSQYASTIPPIPPIEASKRLSVSNWRITRPRPAPSARRIAISRCRVVARASSRFATLAHAISKMLAAATRRSSEISCVAFSFPGPPIPCDFAFSAGTKTTERSLFTSG